MLEQVLVKKRCFELARPEFWIGVLINHKGGSCLREVSDQQYETLEILSAYFTLFTISFACRRTKRCEVSVTW